MIVGSTSTTSSQTSTTTSSTSGSNVADYNAFLKLLVAQLKNQDPTKPIDSTQYLSQLASFSAVEQQTQTNSKLDALMTASALQQADGVIGRTITSSDGTVSGIVASVKIASSGAVAVLQNGTEVPLAAGVVIS
ncbi:MAG: flagellar hook assembly protein FlgD [Hyphomicrobiaceae bacterium]